MDKLKYRIKEYLGKFTIEVGRYEYRGILWWRSRKLVWYMCNDKGTPLDQFQPQLCDFENIDQATNFLEYLKKGPKYYYNDFEVPEFGLPFKVKIPTGWKTVKQND